MGINASFNKSQATQLMNVSSNCDTMFRNFGNIIGNMYSYFTGAAADACKAALQRRNDEIKNIKKEAERIAYDINVAIAEIKEEEAESARERRSRGGGGGRVSSGGPGVGL